jgi:leucyl aminopeptidase
LKPTGSIETMHFDKGGAAAVLGAAFATAKLQPRCNAGTCFPPALVSRCGTVWRLFVAAVFALALAENAIDSKAYKPHAILKSLMGHTVEVRNTDAEGRLMLADAMTFTQQQYKPHAIVDVATLTGVWLWLGTSWFYFELVWCV